MIKSKLLLFFISCPPFFIHVDILFYGYVLLVLLYFFSRIVANVSFIAADDLLIHIVLANAVISFQNNRSLAMGKIQKFLKQSNIDSAVAHVRASREVWPEGDVFGAADIQPEEELLILRELFYADLPGESEKLCLRRSYF